MEKVIVNTLVKNAIKNFKTDPERTARNLIDMASRFSDSRFQTHFYGRLQLLLSNEKSAYYDLIRDTLAKVDEETLLTFSMNLGYDGLYQGTGIIRQQEEKYGYNVPWTISLTIQDGKVYDPYHRVIQEGEEMGIHSWYLFSDHAVHTCINMASQHPDSSFAIFCSSHEVDGTVLDLASEVHNLALIVPFDKEADTTCDLLRLSGILYGVYYTYQESDLPAIESGELMEEIQPLHPAICIFKPKFLCQDLLREKVYTWITKARLEQKFSTVPFDLYGDVRLVDSIISEDPIWVGFDEYGQLNTESGVNRTYGLNIFVNSLSDILKQAFPKRKEE